MTIRNLFDENLPAYNEGRSINDSTKIIKYLSKSDSAVTLSSIANFLKLSIPTVTKLMNELKKRELVVKKGKKETDNGRKPVVYTLRKDKFFAVGVEVLLKRVQVEIYNLDLKSEFLQTDKTFILEDSIECCNKVVDFINNAIELSGIPLDYIVGVGVGLTGRVNSHLGRSYNYFSFDDPPLAEYLSSQLNLPVFIDNDTRVIGLAEQVAGKLKNISNTLIVNISRGIGMSIMANKRFITGSSGFAGEFGHMQFGCNEGRLCICGKKGCLETEVSGRALEVDLAAAIAKGELSLRFDSTNVDNARYDDIIEAANNGDQLSTSLLQAQGEKLGTALGNIINLLNPEMIVISGKYARVGGFFRDSIQYSLHKTALIDPLSNCQISSSDIAAKSGAIGAAAQVFKRYELI